MPTLGRQEVSAPSWGNLPSPIIDYDPVPSLPCGAPLSPAVLTLLWVGRAYIHGIFKRCGLVLLSPSDSRASWKRTHMREGPPMHKQLGKVGAIRREVNGKACRSCGAHTYQLVLRANSTSHAAGLSARCTHCQQPRELDEDLGAILWM